MVNIMKKLLYKLKRLVKSLGLALLCTASLYGATSLAPAYATFFPQLNNHACLAEYSGTHLTCTANDIQVSEVTNVTNPDGTSPVECVLGEQFEFKADFTVITTATSRYGYGIWLPEGNWSAADENPDNTCSVISGKTDGPGIDLDGDSCADISKKAGNSQTHVYLGETITMLCRDDDDSGKADFNYCASWNQQEYGLCDGDNPTPAGSPSKCRCDTFDIDVFIQPDPPDVVKTLTSAQTLPEPGGSFNYTVSFTNPNASTSIFITSLSDEIDIGGEGTFDSSLDLWGAVDVVNPGIDGVYLTATSCTQPADIGNGPGEILPGATYSCMFTVHIVDRDLPNDQSPEFYDDLVKLALEDKNQDPVADSTSCAAIPGSVVGDHCTNEITVQITNLPPDIRVTKTADKASVLEPGEDVEFTITVYNDSATYDSPVVLTSLMDSIYGNLVGKGTCATGGSIALGDNYSCSFTEFVAGDQGDSFTNTVTAIARDDEFDTDTATDMHTVLVEDVPSDISLTKTPSEDSVLETGDDTTLFRDVDFTFLFSVDALGVDDVTFDGLTDTEFGDILADCTVDMKNGVALVPTEPLNGFTLSPGDNASCTITRGLQGDDDDQHNNTATITGEDEDMQPVQAMASATVDFDPVAPASDMAFATSLLVVLEIQNAGIEDLTLTALTVLDNPVVDNADYGTFIIRNAVGGEHANVSYPACNMNEVLGYNGSGTDTYSCAFTIELKPGIENTDDINFLAQGVLNGIAATLTDDDGESDTNFVSVEVNTVEP